MWQGKAEGCQRDTWAGKEQNPSTQSMESRNLEDPAELVRSRKGGTSSLGGNLITREHIGSSPFQTYEISQGSLSRRHKLGLP